MTELATELPSVAPLKSRVLWYQGYCSDADLDEIEKLFSQKFGYAAVKIIITAGAVLAGPIREASDE